MLVAGWGWGWGLLGGGVGGVAEQSHCRREMAGAARGARAERAGGARTHLRPCAALMCWREVACARARAAAGTGLRSLRGMCMRWRPEAARVVCGVCACGGELKQLA